MCLTGLIGLCIFKLSGFERTRKPAREKIDEEAELVFAAKRFVCRLSPWEHVQCRRNNSSRIDFSLSALSFRSLSCQNANCRNSSFDSVNKPLHLLPQSAALGAVTGRRKAKNKKRNWNSANRVQVGTIFARLFSSVSRRNAALAAAMAWLTHAIVLGCQTEWGPLAGVKWVQIRYAEVDTVSVS